VRFGAPFRAACGMKVLGVFAGLAGTSTRAASWSGNSDGLLGRSDETVTIAVGCRLDRGWRPGWRRPPGATRRGDQPASARHVRPCRSKRPPLAAPHGQAAAGRGDPAFLGAFRQDADYRRAGPRRHVSAQAVVPAYRVGSPRGGWIARAARRRRGYAEINGLFDGRWAKRRKTRITRHSEIFRRRVAPTMIFGVLIGPPRGIRVCGFRRPRTGFRSLPPVIEISRPRGRPFMEDIVDQRNWRIAAFPPRVKAALCSRRRLRRFPHHHPPSPFFAPSRRETIGEVEIDLRPSLTIRSVMQGDAPNIKHLVGHRETHRAKVVFFSLATPETGSGSE